MSLIAFGLTLYFMAICSLAACKVRKPWVLFSLKISTTCVGLRTAFVRQSECESLLPVRFFLSHIWILYPSSTVFGLHESA
mmetsp:Transcript_25798/g.68073  ORF Transcript_25798/g.68073 Transcript_25798/m.68073 type:complete len:81 (-) Transcript_25798:199-441(-)